MEKSNSPAVFINLLEAAFESEARIKALIIRDSSLLNTRNLNGETLFHYLVIEGEQRLAELLFDLGADINTQSYSGDTPLSHSVIIRNAEMVEWLIGKGALIEIVDSNQETALSKACSNDRSGIFTLLYSKIDKQNINMYFDDIEASRIHRDHELVMRRALIDCGLRNPLGEIWDN